MHPVLYALLKHAELVDRVNQTARVSYVKLAHIVLILKWIHIPYGRIRQPGTQT